MKKLKKRTKIAEFDLSARCLYMLSQNDIVYLDELTGMSSQEIAGLKNIGRKTVTELTEFIESKGLVEYTPKLKKIIELDEATRWKLEQKALTEKKNLKRAIEDWLTKIANQ